MLKNVVLTGGPTHPFEATCPVLADVLHPVGFDSTIHSDLAAGFEALAQGVDLLTVHCLRWSMSQAEKYAPLRDEFGYALSRADRLRVENHLRRGGGLLAIHTASISFDDWSGWKDIAGAAWVWGRSSHPPLGELSVAIDADHPVTRGVADFTCVDELYSNLDICASAKVLASARTASGLGPQPVVFAHEPLGGRAVYLALGHGPDTFRGREYARLLAQAATWCVSRTG